jgi:phage-related protein
MGDIGNLANGLVNKVKSLFGIASPSKVFAEIGGYLAEGLNVGWDTEFPAIERDMIKQLNGLTTDIRASVIPADYSNSSNGFNQTINITSPQALNPSEVARQTRNATRDLVLAMSI